MFILSGSQEIELVRLDTLRGKYRFAVFDFDGTLSLIREGWREIMIPFMVEILSGLNPGETDQTIEAHVSEFVDELTGQQTIFQMIRLSEEVAARGVQPEDPKVYKNLFNDRLLSHIEARVKRLKSGKTDPAAAVVPGSHAILKALKARDLDLFLASGTDQAYVRQEAALLGIDQYFTGIYGALDNYEDFSKAKLISEILETNELGGDRLLGFGDGYVEIENVAQVNGTAVGVASNEVTKTGINACKRKRLIKAGAALIIPHYLELDPLLHYLYP